MTKLVTRVLRRQIEQMTNMNDVKDVSERYSNAKSMLSALRSTDIMDQVGQKNDPSKRDILLRKLNETQSDPLHRRILSAYASTPPSSAMESMEQELANILLEILD